MALSYCYGIAHDAVTPRAREQPSKKPMLPANHSLQRCASRAAALHPKRAVGRADDPLEREADRIAGEVVRLPTPEIPVAPVMPQINRECATCEGRESKVLEPRPALRSQGRPLDAPTRAYFEPRFGHDFSDVRVHTDAPAQRSARAIQARAYTIGHDVVFGAQHFAPQALEGRRLIAHELTHVLQQRGRAPTVQRAPDAEAGPGAGRAAAVTEAEAAAGFTSEQLEAQLDAEDALRLNSRKRRNKSYAWSLGLKDKKRIQESGKLTPKHQQEITVKLRFFEGEAKAAYLRTISPALVEFHEQSSDILAGRVATTAGGDKETHAMGCDPAQKQFPLLYEGEPEKTRCMDILTDPEFKNNLFDENIKSAVGYAAEPTTWENIEYDRFNVMLVEYRNGTSEYFVLDEVGNLPTGDLPHGLVSHSYLKRSNGLVYPVAHGRIYFSEKLTPNILKRKNGLRFQIKELQSLYRLLELGGMFAQNIGSYSVVGGLKPSPKGLRIQKPRNTLTPRSATNKGPRLATNTGAAPEPSSRVADPASTPSEPSRPATGGSRQLLLPEYSQGSEAQIAELITEHPGLTRVNAERAVQGSHGTFAVRPASESNKTTGERKSPDLEFRRATPAGSSVERRREIKVAGKRHFPRSVRKGTSQLIAGGGGELLVQVPAGTNAQKWVDRFKVNVWHSPTEGVEALGVYRSVRLTVVDPSGNVLFDELLELPDGRIKDLLRTKKIRP